MTLVINELLGRPLLKIYQDPDCFNFSLDSILLANFVTVNKDIKKVVDLGCGNAPIPLYLSLRTKAHLFGIEIQDYSFSLALKSVKINNKENDITILNNDLKNIHEIIGSNCFDIVTSNPPYFKIGDNNINPDIRKAIARHEILCNLEDVIKEAGLLLKNGGRLGMVHRPERLEEILSLMKKYKIEPKRLRFVHPKLDKEANHILIEGIKGAKSGSMIVLKPLIVYNENNKWTDEIINIYNAKED